MGERSRIEWTDATWNPVTGCTSVSDGCRNCYAKRMVERFPKAHGPAQWADVDREVQFSDIIIHPARLDQPLRWKKPRRIFVCSMGDLFHEDVSEEWIDKVIGTMYLAPQHTFMVLTKRPERMRDYIAVGNFDKRTWPIRNLWLGVTAENQEMADQRIPILLQTPAAVRFVSVEPMLEPMDLERYLWGTVGDTAGYFDRNGKRRSRGAGGQMLMASPLNALHWVICGGESGPGARPMHPNWARSLGDQCHEAGVPFFFKQWGEWMAASDPSCPCGPPRKDWMWADGKPFWAGDGDRGLPLFRRIGKKAAGCLLDGREWKEMPEAKG
jgi:protein gp37